MVVFSEQTQKENTEIRKDTERKWQKPKKGIDIILILYYNEKAGLRHGGPGHPDIAAQSVTYSCR